MVSLIVVLLMGGELWDFHHRFDTVRRFPVYGAHGFLRESWEKQR